MNSHELPELLPCPFCGGQPIGPLEHWLLVETKHNIFCSDSRCHAELWASTARRAVLMWNRRAALKASHVHPERVTREHWITIGRALEAAEMAEKRSAERRKSPVQAEAVAWGEVGRTIELLRGALNAIALCDPGPQFNPKTYAERILRESYNPQPPAASVEDVEAQAGKIPTVPQAFFDEFGVNADDRVMDYGYACYAAALRTQHKDVEAQAREAIRFAKDQLERHVDMMMPECDCEDCPQCGKPPSDCTGTACAATCQCSTCDHCSAKDAIAALEAALRTRCGDMRAIALLDEVRSCFTREDDLPGDLLSRIDAFIDRVGKGDV